MLTGLGFLVGEGDGWVIYNDFSCCFRQGVRSLIASDVFVTGCPCDLDVVLVRGFEERDDERTGVQVDVLG